MIQRIAGIDEAGRGPLAGPVVVAAVVFPPGRTPVNGLDDSKALTARKREALYPRIIERALAWKIVFIAPAEIDRRNIYHATLHGMREALLGVAHVADVGPHRRQPPAARPALPGRGLDRRRCTRPHHHGSLYPGQGRPRPSHARAAPAVSALRLRPAQGLSQPVAPAGTAGAWPVPAPSAQFRPGARLRRHPDARGSSAGAGGHRPEQPVRAGQVLQGRRGRSGSSRSPAPTCWSPRAPRRPGA
jgi:hypothetical protein